MRALLRRLAWWLLATVKPAESEIDTVIRAALHDAGIGSDDYAPERVIGPKALEVLHHAATRLGNPILTLGDVKRLLQ